MKHKLICISLLLYSAPLIALAEPEIDFVNSYDAGAHEAFYDVYVTTDGGLIASGVSGPQAAISGYIGSGFLFLVRMESDGRVIWSRSYPDLNGLSCAYSIVETDDGDFVIGCAHNQQFGALRITPDGEVRWIEDYRAGSCQAVIELKNNDFMLAGYDRDGAILARINPAGEAIWERHYNSPGGRGRFYGLRETDGGVVVGGWGFHVPPGGCPWATKVTIEAGEQIWSNNYYFDWSGASFSLVSCGDGGFAMTGWLGSQFYLLKINANGEMLWRESYDRNVTDEAYGMTRLTDGGFVLVGGMRQNPIRPVAMRTSSHGQLRWATEYRLDEFRNLRLATPASFSSVVETADHGIVVAGFAVNAEDGMTDAILMKLGPDIPVVENIIITPEDTLLTLLPDTTIEFSVTAEGGRWDGLLNYEWFHRDSLISRDSIISIPFDSVVEDIIECRLGLDNWTVSIRWHVFVRALFIASSSPDSLDLTLRRGTSQTFSLDTVRAVEGDPVQYQWTLTNLDNFEREDAGSETGVTVEFLRSGNYQMEGLAYRGESSDNVIWTIAVRSAILDFWPRELNLSVPPDSSGEFGVIPFNPESDSLSYRWEVNGDSVGSDSTVTLRFAWNGQAGRSTYAVCAIVMDGAEGDTVRWEVTVQDPAEVGKWASGQVDKWGMLSVSPNPFNSTTFVNFNVQQPSSVSIRAYDLSGRVIATLFDGFVKAGKHSTKWNAADVAAGIYLIKMDASDLNEVQKVILVK